ncbi:MAG: 16S rRNA (guanine(527)-N(7))-methyltransferase RsmG [Acidiferrobacterales bacterium]
MGDQEVENRRQSAQLRVQLLAGARVLGIELDRQATEKLMAYIALLVKWNKAYNLTAINDPPRMVSHHLLDCLAIATYVNGNRVLDIGSGAGLPGIPLALVYPNKKVVLLDSNGKKTRFLTQVVSELELKNVEVVNARVEKYSPAALFDTITARAFSSMVQTLDQSAHLCARVGSYLLMKGREPAQEIAEIGPNFRIVDTHLLNVPGIDGQRRLLIVKIE